MNFKYKFQNNTKSFLLFTFQKNVNLRSLRNKKQFLSQPPKCFYIAKKCPSTYMRHKSSNFLTIHLAKWVELNSEVAIHNTFTFSLVFLAYINTYYCNNCSKLIRENKICKKVRMLLQNLFQSIVSQLGCSDICLVFCNCKMTRFFFMMIFCIKSILDKASDRYIQCMIDDILLYLLTQYRVHSLIKVKTNLKYFFKCEIMKHFSRHSYFYLNP